MIDSSHGEAPPRPTVSVVFLVYNRREELRESLSRMLHESDYPPELVDVIVVDNASEDGAAEMVKAEFPEVRLIRREVNRGISGWNDGFRVASGEYVLALDDDCYLPGDGLRRAVEQAQEHDADLVSFAVQALDNPDYRFDERYRTGLLAFWGCAVLIRRPVLQDLRGYDPEIFVWAHELEFMLRFYDEGYRHLHDPDVVAIHMKATGTNWKKNIGSRSYRINTRHYAYIAAKLLRRRHAVGAFVALIVGNVRDGIRANRRALGAIPGCVIGFIDGLRHRRSLKNGEISRVYRRNFHSYASPWWLSRPLRQLVLAAPREFFFKALGRELPAPPGRKSEYFIERSRYYPTTAATLEF
jgi:GT2 family glycosyltransferase